MADSRAESMQKYLHRAFVNNTYSDKSTHNILRKAVDTSYQYLYEMQKSLVGYEEHYIKITRSVENLRDPNKLYFNKNFKPCININKNEIDICNTRDFRKSEFYNKEISFDDIIAHPEIFHRIPIVTIDNHTIWNFRLHFTDKYVTIILPVDSKIIFEYKRMVSNNDKEHDKRIYSEHDMHIQLIENIFCQQITAVSQNVLTNPNIITIQIYQLVSLILPPKLKRIFESESGDISTALSSVMTVFNNLISLIDSEGIESSWNAYKSLDDIIGKDDYYSSINYYSDNIMKAFIQFKSASDFITSDQVHHEGILFGSIHTDNNVGTNLIEFKRNSTGDKFVGAIVGKSSAYDTETISEFISNSKFVTISFIFIPNMRKHNAIDYRHFVNNDGELEMPLMVPMKNESAFEPFIMPIPIENCMVFRKNANTSVRELVPYTRLKLYYPNIYQITDYEVHMSTLETPDSVAKIVVDDDIDIIDGEIRLCDARQYLPFVNVGDTVYVKIDDSRDEYHSYEFYYAYKEEYDVKYTPVTAFYLEFISDRLYPDLHTFEDKLNALYRDTNSEYRSEFIGNILTYEAYIHTYGDIDFIHRYKNALFVSDKIESRKYEDSVLKAWVKNEPNVLRDYVVEQHKKNASYYLYTAAIDLESRRHTDTSTIIPTKVLTDDGTNPINAVDGHEPNAAWYVFTMVNTEPEGMLNHIRVYVDNLAVTDDIFHVRDGYIDYICIPTKYVTNNSFIEVEIMSEFYFEDKITFTSLDDSRSYSIASPNEHVQPTISDFVIYGDDPTKRLPPRYDTDFFRVSTVTEYGEFLSSHGSDLHPLNFLKMTTFKIYPTDEDILNIPLTIRFSKMCEGNRYIVPNNDEVYLEFVDNRFAYSNEFLRVYINGRLVARENYLFYPMYHHPRIRFIEDENFQIQKDDVIYIEVTPYRYKQVYFNPDISPEGNEYYEIIDLKSIIKKPFDIRYYDIYVNGKKLSINNCIPLDPWSVKLINLKSKYNLVIFEKERDFEFYGIDFTKDHPYPTIEDFLINHSGNTSIIKGFLNQFISRHIPTFIDETTGEVVPIEVNENENTETREYYPGPEHQYIYFIFESFYFDELIGKGFINPDIMQLSYMIMREWFSEVYDVYKTSAVESTHDDEPNARRRREDYIHAITIDPDLDFVNREPEEGEDSVPTVVFPVGHPNEVSQTILDEEIVMKTEKTIDKYVPMALINDIDWEESDE